MGARLASTARGAQRASILGAGAILGPAGELEAPTPAAGQRIPLSSFLRLSFVFRSGLTDAYVPPYSSRMTITHQRSVYVVSTLSELYTLLYSLAYDDFLAVCARSSR